MGLLKIQQSTTQCWGSGFGLLSTCILNKSRAKRNMWTASSEFGTYRLCEQRMFRRACASAQSRQNLRCSLMQAVSQAKSSNRKPDPWPLWMAGHAQLKCVMMECSKTHIRLTGLIWRYLYEGVGFVLWVAVLFLATFILLEFELRHEKTCLMAYANNKAANIALYIQVLDKFQKFKTLTSLCCWAGRFEFDLVAQPRSQVFSRRG